MTELKNRGAHMIRSLDISSLPSENRRALDYAIVYTIPLRPQDELDWPAFDRAEMEGEALAEWLTHELISMGYEAYPHTLNNVFNSKTLCSPLPNKTLAVLAGLGGEEHVVCQSGIWQRAFYSRRAHKCCFAGAKLDTHGLALRRLHRLPGCLCHGCPTRSALEARSAPGTTTGRTPLYAMLPMSGSVSLDK